MSAPDYDVAFSFVTEDEPLASQINEILRDRLTTFFAPRNQEELVGRDGEAEFRRVFSGAATVVVVLYREQWGQTPWTIIEENAIRDRGHQQQYDFLLLIPTNDPLTPPDWLPKRFIWGDLQRLGVKGAVGAISQKLTDLGTKVPAETAIEKAQRLARQLEYEKQRAMFRGSADYTKTGEQETDNLIAILKQRVEKITASPSPLPITAKPDKSGVVVASHNYSVGCWWTGAQVDVNRYECYLHIGLWQGIYSSEGIIIPEDRAKKLIIEKYSPDIFPSGSFCWLNKKTNEQLTSQKLAEHWLSALFEIIGKTSGSYQ